MTSPSTLSADALDQLLAAPDTPGGRWAAVWYFPRPGRRPVFVAVVCDADGFEVWEHPSGGRVVALPIDRGFAAQVRQSSTMVPSPTAGGS